MVPRFSIITPVYNPPITALRDTITSVRNQTFSDWEWCLADDVSTDPEVLRVLERAARRDPRIRIVRRSENGGISRASNDALAIASGEFVAFLDHDDLLTPNALESVDVALRAHEGIDFVYSDEARLAANGVIDHVFYKPDWSPERMNAQMYTCHFAVMRRLLVDQVGGFRPEFDGSQDYDLVLRISEHAGRIHHIPEVLYLWRAVPGSAADTVDAKPWALDAGRRAIEAHCRRTDAEATVEMTNPGVYRVHRTLQSEPLVSIVIPTRGSSGRVHGESRVQLLHALRSIVDATTYSNFEVVLVADRETPIDVLTEAEKLLGDRLRLRWFDGPFNFSKKMNAGVLASGGDIVISLNDDVEVITPNWIEELVVRALLPDVGVVGCKLLLADGTLQHAGHLYVDGLPHHPYFGFDRDDRGPVSLLEVDREVSGNTAACIAVKRSVWELVGGMSEQFPNNYNDVDFSLKVRDAGFRNVWTPHVELFHFESMTRDGHVHDWEFARIRDRWDIELHNDPCFNPNLSLNESGYMAVVAPEEWLGGLRWTNLG